MSTPVLVLYPGLVLPAPILAADDEGSVGGVVFWSIVLFLLLIVGFWAVTRLKRRMADTGPQPGAEAGFTLSDLRRLHREGQMSDEEFERAKAKIVEVARRNAAADASRTDNPPRPTPRSRRV